MLLTENNYIEYCKSKYTNIHCLNEDEFLDDLKTLRYIKSFFRRYLGNNDVKIEILLNHFIYIHNCFGESMVEILFFDFEDYYHPMLKTTLVYLDMMPEKITFGESRSIYSDDIAFDMNFYKKLNQSKHNYFRIKNV